MKLPWVSREAFEARGEGLIRQQVNHAAQLASERVRYDALLDKYIALATKTPVVPERTLPDQSIPATIASAREPSVITQTIREEAAGDPRLTGYLRRRARELKLEHPDWEPAQIAEQLGSWQTTEREGVEPPK